MDETLTSPKMEEINLINKLERITSMISNRILKEEWYIVKSIKNKN